MTDYKGTFADGNKIRALELERQRNKERLAEEKREIERKNEVRAGKIQEKFASVKEDTTALLAKSTIGLVTYDDFKRTREMIEQSVAPVTNSAEAEQRAKEKKRKTSKSALSFDVEDEAQDEAVSPTSKKSKLGKNPAVNTDFLPDQDREAEEAAEKARLGQEWEDQQNAIKAETISIAYSFWDGSGHRRTLQCTKGTTIAQFLAMVRQEFRELKTTSVENLMYIKEDLIIPHDYTFYDFIVNKARGKSGPLFHFDVHDDVRLVADARIEKEESHAGKVVERHWYEKNKHIFPASRWEVYDPRVERSGYTIHDYKKEKQQQQLPVGKP